MRDRDCELMDEDSINSLICNTNIHNVETDIDLDSESRSFTCESEVDAGPTSTQYIMTIADGTFFELATKKCTLTNTVAICKKCGPQKYEIRGHRNSSSNFLANLERKYGIGSIKEFQQYAKKKKTAACAKLNSSAEK